MDGIDYINKSFMESEFFVNNVTTCCINTLETNQVSYW